MPDPDDSDRHDSIDAVLAEYMLRLDQGEDLDSEVFIRQHPSYAAELREYFQNKQVIQRMMLDPPLPIDRDSSRSHAGCPHGHNADDDQAAESRVRSASDPSDDFTTPFDPAARGDIDETRTLVPQASRGTQRYTILRPHAKGGLGKVSVARDEELHREVAFKELQERFAASVEAQSRFVLEAEVTGSLEHPGIVPIYGLGRDSEGRPFYAMRFIRGDSLKTAILLFHRQRNGSSEPDSGKRNLQFRKLLSHFVAVCQAMHYAHSRGVIHRDIKPANIMLGEFGETLVVDWGLAKVAGSSDLAIPKFQAASSGSSIPTQMGTVVGTPAYMSPEQAAGQHDQVTPASDIYSLGATLFTLLTGEQAFRQEDICDLLNAVRNGIFPAPREINVRVPAPLESICLKAMAHDPAKRYASCLELAGDIEHWLADEPVAAHRETFVERTSRWTRRHRAWTRAISAAVVITAVVAVAAALLVNRARHRAEELAVRNAELATSEEAAKLQAVHRLGQARSAVDTWLTGTSEILRYLPGVEQARQRLLEQAAIDYEKFAFQENDDPDLELERARTYLRLGDVRRMLNQFDDAEGSYRGSVDLLTRLMQQYPGRPEMQVEWANAQTRLAMQLVDRDRLAEAETAYSEAENVLRDQLKSQLQNTSTLDALATNRLNHATAMVATGADDRAAAALEESIKLFERLAEGAPDESRYMAGLATAQSLLGQLQVNQGAPSEGDRTLRRSLKSFTGLVAKEPDNPGYVVSRGNTLTYIASASRLLGEYQEEQDCYEKAARDFERLAASFPAVPEFAETLAMTWVDLGQLLQERGLTQGAEAVLAKAVTKFAELAVSHPSHHVYQQELAVCRETLGRVLSDLGRDEESKEAFELALTAYKQFVSDFALREYRERLAVCQSHYGQLLHKLHDHEAAKAAFELADRCLSELVDQNPDMSAYQDERAFVLRHLGTLLWAINEKVSAESAFTTSRGIWEALIARDPRPEYCDHLAWFLANCPVSELQASAVAVQYARQATAAVPKNARYQATLGAALYRQRQYQPAIASLQTAERLNSPDDGRICFYLALALLEDEQRKEALEALAEGIQRMDASRPGSLELRALRDEAKGRCEGKTDY